jgi:hypothetical protein
MAVNPKTPDFSSLSEFLVATGPDESFAERICLRAPHRCCDDLKVEVRERLIESGGKDCVVVVEDKPAGMVQWYSFAQLLEGPSGSWMRRHVKVNKPARSMFHNHQHVKLNRFVLWLFEARLNREQLTSCSS